MPKDKNEIIDGCFYAITIAYSFISVNNLLNILLYKYDRTR